MVTTQRVGDHILGPHNELGNQIDPYSSAQRRSWASALSAGRTSPFPDIRKSGSVVCEDPDYNTLQQMTKVVEFQTDCPKLLKIDETRGPKQTGWGDEHPTLGRRCLTGREG